jgi:hypothetical protein
LSSEGTEENKILSTSLLILPMLTHMFQAGDKEAVKAVVSDSSISQLMESLFNESPSSSKLTAQLLRLVTGMFFSPLVLVSLPVPQPRGNVLCPLSAS